MLGKLSHNDKKRCLDSILNVSTFLQEKCLVSASICLDCGQQAVKQNKKVTSNCKYCFLENHFQFTKLCLLFHYRGVRKIAKSDY
jgi:hypothetical protein